MTPEAVMTTLRPEVLEELRKLHRELAPSLVESICRRCTDAGGSTQDIIFLLEHVVVAVLVSVVIPEGYDEVLDVLAREVRRKLANQKLAFMDTKGNA